MSSHNSARCITWIIIINGLGTYWIVRHIWRARTRTFFLRVRVLFFGFYFFNTHNSRTLEFLSDAKHQPEEIHTNSNYHQMPFFLVYTHWYYSCMIIENRVVRIWSVKINIVHSIITVLKGVLVHFVRYKLHFWTENEILIA